MEQSNGLSFPCLSHNDIYKKSLWFARLQQDLAPPSASDAKKPKENPNKVDTLASSNDSWQNAEDKNARDKELVILKATVEPCLHEIKGVNTESKVKHEAKNLKEMYNHGHDTIHEKLDKSDQLE